MENSTVSEPRKAGGTGAGLRRFETALWVSGLILIAVFIGVRVDAFLGRKTALKQFEAAKTAARSAPAPAAGSAAPAAPAASGAATSPGGAERSLDLPRFSSPDKTLWSPERVRGFDASFSQHFAATPLAILRVPKIDLEVPVLAGTDEVSLNRGVGHIAGTPRPGEPGNVGIAGHRDGFFRGLKDIATGDALEVETLAGTDHYRIEKITIVSPDRVDVLAPSEEPTVTLVTCFPFYYAGSAPQRYIVRATLDGSAVSQIAERRSRAP
jgi:sortase A